jgi:DNA-binding XRE family transcriptional regulator
MTTRAVSKGEPCPTCGRMMRTSIVGKTPLAKALFAHRLAKKCDLRTAAKDAGVPMPTYYRAERGRMPDVATFAALARWMKVPMEDLL